MEKDCIRIGILFATKTMANRYICSNIFGLITVSHSGTSKHQNRSLFEESMKPMVSWYQLIIKQSRPQQFASPHGCHIELKYDRQLDHILAHISSYIAPRTNIHVSISMFSMSGNFWNCHNCILRWPLCVLHYFVSYSL